MLGRSDMARELAAEWPTYCFRLAEEQRDLIDLISVQDVVRTRWERLPATIRAASRECWTPSIASTSAGSDRATRTAS